MQGTVQGVGFRPFVHRLASELRLGGFVRNQGGDVWLEIEGQADAIAGFLGRLVAQAPPLARVELVETEDLPVTGAREFAIRSSRSGARPEGPVAADTATCADCLAELFDPADRRHRYPFINCTNCGPRFTIVLSIPYDRPNTTMAQFAMCDRCRAEYEDPGNRRFHAQPNACPDCGPRLRLIDSSGGRPPGAAEDPARAAAETLQSGAIVAVKGLGGFHLACRADNEEAVARLRTGKHREEKPFALMVANVRRAGGLVELGGKAAELLQSPARPIVLAPRRPDAPVAAGVAPGSSDLGVMLPYSPLHHLLASEAGGPLVMTSGNQCDEPIAYRNRE
ncbi:MAG TPA: Sua5/YciO/YrdC/YwlC family protein, partial [Solirubrobacteraceae bacterium]|nr:Sua5/YciO/YrdC/YwlC family protein [Solirubrobacteraceae bacterium]